MSATATGQGYTKLLDHVMSREDLSLAARVVYCRVLRYRRIPTAKKIAENLSLSYDVCRKALAELVAAGMLNKVGYGAYSVGDEANQVSQDANPTRETLERETKDKTSASAQEEEMILGSYGETPESQAEDLPKPRKRRTVPVEKWHGGTLAAYMDEQVIANYFGKATVQRAKIAGFLKHRMKKGISPVEVKEVIDAFIGNPANAEQPLDMSSLFLREFDGLLARVRTLVPASDSPSDDLLAAYTDLLDGP